MHRFAATRGVRAILAKPTRAKALAVELTYGAVVGFLIIGVRAILDVITPGAGPFALIYPGILFATLYGRWSAGLITYAMGIVWSWWWVLPVQGSFTLANPLDYNRLYVNAACGLVTLFLAEAFRAAVERSAKALDSEIERRGHMMLEFAHRTKNNFAMVASLLSLQGREQTTPEAKQSFDLAVGRVHSFTKTYEVLSEGVDIGDRVAMDDYLERLVDAVRHSLFDGSVLIETEIAEIALPKAKALAIGLVLNEAMTNAAKYAFLAVADPRIAVLFRGNETAWCLQVDDNGVGVDPGSIESLGTRIMTAFANQADALLTVEPRNPGTRVLLEARS